MENKKRLTLTIISITLVTLVSLVIYVFLGRSPVSDEEILDEANSSDTPVTDSSDRDQEGISNDNAGTTANLSYTRIDSNTIAFEGSTSKGIKEATIDGSIWAYNVYEDKPEIPLVRLPQANLEYVFLTHNSEDDHVIFKQLGEYYSFDTKLGKTLTLPNDIEYALLDPILNKLYYITKIGATSSEIKVIDANGENNLTLVSRPNIEWISLVRGQIFYRTSTALYRYALDTKQETLIEQASDRISASFSPDTLQGIVEVDGTSYLYTLDQNRESLATLGFYVDPRTVIWQENERAFYNIKDNTLFKYDWQSQTSQSWSLADTIEATDIDYENVQAFEDGALMFMRKGDSSIYLYPGTGYLE